MGGGGEVVVSNYFCLKGDITGQGGKRFNAMHIYVEGHVIKWFLDPCVFLLGQEKSSQFSRLDAAVQPTHGAFCHVRKKTNGKLSLWTVKSYYKTID